MTVKSDTISRQKARTRRAIIAAFNDLVLNGHGDDIRVKDIVQRADIGRSTFYEHFSNVSDVYMTALARPLGALADCATGRAGEAEVAAFLDHVAGNRRRAIQTFSGRMRDKVTRLLAGLITQRDAERRQAVPIDTVLALQIAGAFVALISAWLAGNVHGSPGEISQRLVQGAAALRRGPE